jgi:hypothetical protein
MNPPLDVVIWRPRNDVCDDPGAETDQQKVVVDLHPLLATTGTAEAVAVVITDRLAALPFRNALAS